MKRKQASPLITRRVKILGLAISLFYLCLNNGCLYSSIYSYAQSAEKVREIPGFFVAEDGCPVSVTSIKTALDLDPFEIPIDGKIYINYKNTSDKQIEAVKFRIRLVDKTGAELGTFQAADGASLSIGMEHAQKWRREPIDQRTSATKVRVLLVKYADGTMWQSAKMQEIDAPTNKFQTSPDIK